MGLLWRGWLVWAVVLLVTGIRHPPVPAYPGLSRGRRLLALLALGMLLLGYAGQGLSGEPSWGLTITYVAMVVAALAAWR